MNWEDNSLRHYANSSKKLGLPAYLSHQYSVTLRVELPFVGQVEGESARLYDLLQQCVAAEIRNVGYPPEPNKGNGSPRDTSAFVQPHKA